MGREESRSWCMWCVWNSLVHREGSVSDRVPALVNTLPGHVGFPGGAVGKEPACQCSRGKRCRFNPWVGKIPWEGNGNPLPYSCLGNPMDRGAWRAAVHRVAKSWTSPSTDTLHGPFLGLGDWGHLACKVQSLIRFPERGASHEVHRKWRRTGMRRSARPHGGWNTAQQWEMLSWANWWQSWLRGWSTLPWSCAPLWGRWIASLHS